MNITELRAYVASNEYGAELALQHAMRLLSGMEQERALADRLAVTLDAIGSGGKEQFQWSLTKAELISREALAAWKEARK